MGDEDVLAVFREGHEIGFPVPRVAAGRGRDRPFINGNTVLERLDGRAALLSAPSATGLCTRQVVAPGAVVRASHLGIDEAVDGLVTNDAPTRIGPEPAGDLLGRPAPLQGRQHLLAQGLVAVEPCPLPASLVSLALGVGWLVADIPAGVTLQFSADRRRIAAERLSDRTA